MTTDRLITTGPYSYSRNPQLLGWALVLLGVATAGRSGAALALTAIYWVGCVNAEGAREVRLQAMQTSANRAKMLKPVRGRL